MASYCLAEVGEGHLASGQTIPSPSSASPERGKLRYLSPAGRGALASGHQRLQVRLGPRAIVRDHFGGADRAEAQAVLQAAAIDVAVQEPGGEQVARASGIDHLSNRLGWHFGIFAARNGDRARLAARDDQRRHLLLQRLDPVVEVVAPGQRGEFDMVGKQDVDLASCDQRPEIVAMAIDDESVGQGEGHFAPRAAMRKAIAAARGSSGSHR